MPEYPQLVNLIPYGLPQFLDFEAAPEKIRRIQKSFVESTVENEEKALICQLDPLLPEPEEECYYYEKDLAEGKKRRYAGQHEKIYTMQPERHLAPYLGKWLPVPFLRQSGDKNDDGTPTFRPGPTNWARAYITRVPSKDDPDVLDWRVVLAFDMQVDDRQTEHVALTPDDVTAKATCSLAHEFRDNSWFLSLGWVSGWLQQLWDEYYANKNNQRYRPFFTEGEERKPAQQGHLAAYMLYLKVLQEAIDGRAVGILNLSGGQDKPAEPNSTDTIDVDFILDIGNARSTGILVENILGKDTDLNDSYLLSLRDMTHPENFYSDPFETRVEFSRADFGEQSFSKRSGRRTNAFSWASPVRTGNEATRLANMSVNASGSSGMTSPKRYLWDQEEAPNLWFFNRTSSAEREELISTNPICRYINNQGTSVGCLRELNFKGENPPPKSYLAKLFAATLDDCRKQEALPANQPRFSRSSMMMFLLMELVQQALVTINSPAQRYKRQYHDRPRRLRSIIFTVPPGMSFAEQRIYRRWAYAAVNLLWEALGWKKHFYIDPQTAKANKNDPLMVTSRDYRLSPEIRSRWDEATCTQLVYLYNEITRNYQGDAHLFFEIMGREREVPREDKPKEKEKKPTLRIATIDIGGGTTDLSITTYILANDRSSTDRIVPHQDFRDGVNLGGDDILRQITMDILFQAIIDYLIKEKKVGRDRADQAMKEMFGKKSDQVSVQNQRIQFLRLVIMPIAYEALNQYEKLKLEETTSEDTGSEVHIALKDFFPAIEDSNVPEHKMLHESIEFFNQEIKRRANLERMDLLDLDLHIPIKTIDKVIGESLGTALNNMGEIISAYDCDVLLLSGRPSCWNAVNRRIFAMVPVAPDRVIPMHQYQVGDWYPFANARGFVEDPKTTVVTGAILCTLAENSIEGFVFDTSKLQLKSTARFVGQMPGDRLPKEMVWFPNENPDKKNGESKYVKIVDFSSPITIGYRQISAGRWSATRCWRMEFANEEARRAAENHTPYKVKVEFVQPGADEGLEAVPDLDRDIKARLDEPQIAYNEPEAVMGKKHGSGGEEYEEVRGRPLTIKLRTLAKQDEDGCWMDTGVLYLN